VRLSDDVASALPAIILGFFVAGAISLVATPIVTRYAHRFGMVDRPEARRVNKQAIARGGGIAIMLGFVIVSAALIFANSIIGMHFVDQPQIVKRPQILALLGGAILAVGIGFLDDWFQLRARWQFLGQFLLAGVAVALGVAVVSLNDPLAPSGTLDIPGLIGAGVAFLWIVGMINSINFIDGLDGLSSGIALIAALTLGIISLTANPVEPYVAMFCFALAGALAGFLRWNFHPASIFAGTSGIMLVGYSLAVLSILGTAKVAVAALVLGVPIIDTFWIIVRRLSARKSPFAPDRGHIHHRLLDLGLSHRGTVLLIYAVCIVLAGLSLLLSNTGQMYAFMGLVVVSGLGLFFIERIRGGAGEISEGLTASSYTQDGGDTGDQPAPATPATPAAEESPNADEPTPTSDQAVAKPV
jgi:UDP-GlcNAc:undecaprenyl-phosphate GlcNAc-1-phosphate transferase